MGLGEGRGKLLLFGEHAAVYGQPAVGIGLPRTVTVRTEPADRGGIVAPHLDGEDETRLAELFDFMRSLELPFEVPKHLSVSIESSVPRASGLGSSAALSVALVRALSERLELDTLWRSANLIERYFHGTPSGIDTGLSLSAGVQALRPAPPDIPSAVRLQGIPFVVVVGTVTREQSTKRLVASVRSRMESRDRRTEEAIERLGLHADRAIESLSGSGTIEDIAESAGEAQLILADLDLTTELLDRTLERALELGALGAKLSGAGGGGAFFAVVENRDTGHRCATGLARWATEHRLPVHIHGVFGISGGVAVDLS